MPANILLLLSTLLWGIWGYTNKLAVGHAHPLTVQWMYSIPIALMIPVYYWLGATTAPATNMNGDALKYALISGLMSGAAGLLYFFAVRNTSASVATAITAAYPIVTLFLAVLLQTEAFTWRKLIGILVVIGGIVLLQSEGS
ncbi:MAG: DMT family transporter [Anaerolineae bacterium]|nr:DMT family transporter [Anaerolineae bacterium]